MATSMTRKHFQAVADAVKALPLDANSKRMVVHNLSCCLRQFNDNFNSPRFALACYTQQDLISLAAVDALERS